MCGKTFTAKKHNHISIIEYRIITSALIQFRVDEPKNIKNVISALDQSLGQATAEIQMPEQLSF